MVLLSITQADFGRARRLLEEQLEIDFKTFGNAHEKTAESKVTLGLVLLRHFNDPENAEVLFEQAITFYEREFQNEATKQRLAETLDCLQEALQIRADQASRKAKAVRPVKNTPNTKTSFLDSPSRSSRYPEPLLLSTHS